MPSRTPYRKQSFLFTAKYQRILSYQSIFRLLSEHHQLLFKQKLLFNIFVRWYRQEVSNSNCSEGPMRTYEVTRGPHYDADATMALCLNLTRDIFYILFPAKGIVGYREIISSRLYICLKGTCSLAGWALLNNSVTQWCLNWVRRSRFRGSTKVIWFQ